MSEPPTKTAVDSTKKSKLSWLPKVFRAVIFRLSGIGLWLRLMYGPIAQPEETISAIPQMLFLNQGLVLAILICATIVGYIFVNPLMIAWYILYLIVFPLAVLVLALKYLMLFLGIISKVLKKAATIYVFVLCIVTMPIVYIVLLGDPSPDIAVYSRWTLIVMTFITLIFIMRLSRNPFLWIKPLIDLAEKIFDHIYGKKAFDSLGNKTREEIEKKIKDSIDFIGHLQKLSQGLTSRRSLFNAWSVKLFLIIFLMSSLLVIFNFSIVYYSLHQTIPSSWSQTSPYDVDSLSSWFYHSIAVFTTSSYLHSLPANSHAMMLCALETVCAILVITIFFLQFTYSSRMELEETLVSLSSTIESKRRDINQATKEIEVQLVANVESSGEPKEAIDDVSNYIGSENDLASKGSQDNEPRDGT